MISVALISKARLCFLCFRTRNFGIAFQSLRPLTIISLARTIACVLVSAALAPLLHCTTVSTPQPYCSHTLTHNHAPQPCCARFLTLLQDSIRASASPLIFSAIQACTMTATTVRGDCRPLSHCLRSLHAIARNTMQQSIFLRAYTWRAGEFEVLAVELYMLKPTWD